MDTIKRFLHRYVGFMLVLCSCSSGRFAANSTFPMPEPGYIPDGTLEEVFYSSSAGGPSHRRMLVYLPPGYDDGADRYPVLYLLHGARGNELSWINEGRVLQNMDSLTRCGKMQKTIVVFPNMNRYKDEEDFGKSRKKNALESSFGTDGGVETMVVKEVVSVADSIFRTIPHKEARAVAGLSVGAYQAVQISATFPDAFGYVGVFSPVIRTYTVKGPFRHFYKGLYGKMKMQFADAPKVYCIMSGRNDVFYPRIQRLIMHMEAEKYPFEFIPTSGGHTWTNWEDYSVLFMQKLWK